MSLSRKMFTRLGQHSRFSQASLRREQNDSNNNTYKFVKSSDLVNHPFRYRCRVWPQTSCDFGDSVNRPFALPGIRKMLCFVVVIVVFPSESRFDLPTPTPNCSARVQRRPLIRECLSTGYGLRFSTEIYGSRREQTRPT